jgi:hypothetical protein
MLNFSIIVGQTNYILKDPMDGFMSLKIKIIFKPKLKNMTWGMYNSLEPVI